MINSQNFFRTAFGAKTLFETLDQPFDQSWISEKRLQMPLRLHQIVKDQHTSLPSGTELRAGESSGTIRCRQLCGSESFISF
jgi:hypothetical protein